MTNRWLDEAVCINKLQIAMGGNDIPVSPLVLPFEDSRKGVTGMKKMLIPGILLILLGIVSLAGEGIPYKKNKDAINVGPVHASTQTTMKVLIPPALGGVMLAGGVLLVAVGIARSKKK